MDLDDLDGLIAAAGGAGKDDVGTPKGGGAKPDKGAGDAGDALDDLDALIAQAQVGSGPAVGGETSDKGLDLDALASMPLPGTEAAAASAVTAAAAMVGALAPAAAPAAAATAVLDDETRERLEKLQRLMKIKIPLIVCLAEKHMSLEGILNLAEGSLIQFEKTAESMLELMVNNRVIGYGEAVKIGENFGLQVKQICDPRQTIEHLGP